MFSLSSPVEIHGVDDSPSKPKAFRVRRALRQAGPNGLPCSGALKETGPRSLGDPGWFVVPVLNVERGYPKIDGWFIVEKPMKIG